MGLVMIAILVLGLIAYTLDVSTMDAVMIVLCIAILCRLIWTQYSKFLSKDAEKKQKRIGHGKCVGAMLIALGLITAFAGYEIVSGSEKIVPSASTIITLVRTPSVVGVIGLVIAAVGGVIFYASRIQGKEKD